jgi:hypothetical protein
MPLIEDQNLCLYLSGGLAVPDNRYAYNSLGGARSVAQMGNQPGCLFPPITSLQATGGITQYRCVYFRNDDANPNGLLDGMLSVAVPTISAGTELALGLAPEGLNGVAQLIADEETAPANVAFSQPYSKDDSLTLPTPMQEGDQVAVWVKRIVSPGASCFSDIDYGTLLFTGRSVE